MNFVITLSKRRNTGGKKKAIRKKRKYELGRPPANTKVSEKIVYLISFVSLAHSVSVKETEKRRLCSKHYRA